MQYDKCDRCGKKRIWFSKTDEPPIYHLSNHYGIARVRGWLDYSDDLNADDENVMVCDACIKVLDERLGPVVREFVKECKAMRKLDA